MPGLKPIGYLFAMLYDKGPIKKGATPYRIETLNVAREELSYSFDGLEYGEYVLGLAHDENKNMDHDFDSEGLLPVEGLFIVNMEKLGPAWTLKDLTFGKLKFSFNEPEKTIEAKMMYPPFIKKPGN